MDSSLPPLVIIAGSTASGKSSLALSLAEQTGGSVINADSAQVYRDLRIVTARPSAAETERAPHFLYGTRDGARPCSAAAWAADARAAIDRVHASGGLPILVGGTGLYIRTLIDGIAPVPEIDPAIRAAVRAMPTSQAHAALAIEDPKEAAALGCNDTARVTRALEVVRSTGTPISAWRERKTGGLAGSVRLLPLILLPPRDELYARCDTRFEQMAGEQGLSEVAALLDRKLDPALPIMRAIGVPELAAYIRGETSRDRAIQAGRTATRQYAKRQYTWFSRQPPADWSRHTQSLDCEERANVLAALHARLPG